MRIAFVGKGGSGKSTMVACFSLYLKKISSKLPIVVFDADLNVHAPNLLGCESMPSERYLSHQDVEQQIKKWLLGKNKIDNLGAFRKTTPPTRKSNLIFIEKIDKTPLAKFCLQQDNMYIFAVGTYHKDEIGASCYHNNLSVFENILTHLDDKNGYVVADMVAGVDAFAGSLYAQFDLTCLVTEPTKKSIEVYKQYSDLAKEAGTWANLYVVGNKIRDDEDKAFIASQIPKEKILGMFWEDKHLRDIDRKDGEINFSSLAKNNQLLLQKIGEKLSRVPDNRNTRLKKIFEIHTKYVSQAFVKDRFGDLTTQIDKEFKFL